MSEETSLARITQATALLAKAKSLEAVLEVHSQASAIEAYARAKGADEAHCLALEVKLRSERKAGSFLTEMKQKGELKSGRPDKEGNAVKLNALGIGQMESKRWQKIAKIPEPQFESYIQTAVKATEANLLALASSRFDGPMLRDPPSQTYRVSSSKELAMVELFSGKHKIADRFREAGWIADTVDIIDGQDIMKWEPKRKYVLVHSGDPCQSYSNADRQPYETTWEADVTLWRRAEDLIRKIHPKLWTRENVKLTQWVHGKAPYHWGPFFFWGWFPFEKMPKLSWNTSVKGFHRDRETGARWEEDKTPAERAEYPPALVNAYFEVANAEIKLEVVNE